MPNLRNSGLSADFVAKYEKCIKPRHQLISRLQSLHSGPANMGIPRRYLSRNLLHHIDKFVEKGWSWGSKDLMIESVWALTRLYISIGAAKNYNSRSYVKIIFKNSQGIEDLCSFERLTIPSSDFCSNIENPIFIMQLTTLLQLQFCSSTSPNVVLQIWSCKGDCNIFWVLIPSWSSDLLTLQCKKLAYHTRHLWCAWQGSVVWYMSYIYNFCTCKDCLRQCINGVIMRI